MAQAKTAHTPVTVVVGGDAYINDQTVRDLCHQAMRRRPDAERIELDAASADQYAFDEAVSPSLLSDTAIVIIRNLQDADESLGNAILAYCRQTAAHPHHASVVICQHEGGAKGKRLLDQLERAGARRQQAPNLNKADAKLNFVIHIFEQQHRRIEMDAARQLVAVLGGHTGELAAMCHQLCCDFDDNPIGLQRVNQYLTGNPQATGFDVADTALDGHAARAIVMMRAAVAQGTDPLALIGVLAMKLRTMAKASAVRSGTISKAEAQTKDWILKRATRQLSGWTSDGMSRCIRMLAWADEQSKTNGGDPVYALERSIELIAARGQY